MEQTETNYPGAQSFETSANRKRVPEGRSTRNIEKRTMHIPSALFLVAAGGSILGSLWLKTRGRDRDSLFVGQWAPTFLMLGTYNKLVKQFGHE